MNVIAGSETKAKARTEAPVAPRDLGRSFAALVVLLIVALPAMLTAIAVLSTLGRPLLFRQRRAGLAGHVFTIVKFRTMHDIRDADGLLLPDAERETRLTRFLRRVRLDELPQILAILRGDMAFIGPRPLPPVTVASFGRLGVLRSQVRPGLTGWAQVNGNTRLSDPEKLALDVWYVDHRRATLDARILLLTGDAILRGERIRPGALATAQAHLARRSASMLLDASANGGLQ